MHKINICIESKMWIKHCSSIDKKIKQILKKVLKVKKIFDKKILKLQFCLLVLIR